MISVSNYRYLRVLAEAAGFALLMVAALVLLSVVSAAQTPARRPQLPTIAPPALPAAQIAEPVYREYRGVQIGMSKEQVRQRLVN